MTIIMLNRDGTIHSITCDSNELVYVVDRESLQRQNIGSRQVPWEFASQLQDKILEANRSVVFLERRDRS